MNTGKGLLQRVYGACGVFLLAVIAGISPVQGESLWEPGFSGYITPRGTVNTGDQLLVEITPNTELTLKSSQVDSVNARLNFSGGDGEGLFDFLPEGSSEADRDVEQEDSLSLNTRIAVLVVDKDDNGVLTLRGERSVEINGLREHIVLSGTLSPSNMRRGRPVPFESLSNAELIYSGAGYGQANAVTAEDLERTAPEGSNGGGAAAEETEEEEIDEEEIDEDEPGEEEETGEAEEAAGEAEEPAAEGTGAENDRERGYTISEERREELLLEYINRFINVLFSR
ncbi:MAG: flagellar basal body L-ring protein FlgH [Spirochaetaceae bacterium]